MLWLLGIVFIPLPTQLAGTNDDGERLVYALYIGTLFIICSILVLLTWTMQIEPEVHVDPDRPPQAIEGVTITVTMLAALILAVTVPGLGMSAMFVVFLTSPFERWRHRRVTQRAARPPL